MSDALDAVQPDGGPVSSDPGYAAWLGYTPERPSGYAPLPVNDTTQPPGWAAPPPPPPLPQPVPPVPPKKSHKLRNSLLGIVGLIVAIVVATHAGGESKHSGSTNSGSSNSGVSRGLAAQDATGDVKLGPPQAPDVLGIRYETVTVVNHSSKRSDYVIDVAVQSADGKTQYDTGTALINNVDPGQTASDKVMFTNHIPAGAKIVLKTVERTAAL
ncbi:MAG TPA: hypothetical protein VKB37_19790 [Jatrophihabitantaceae bacterium]|nr:hypothetical protein [Jatrophihabitantaceae bacterium]